MWQQIIPGGAELTGRAATFGELGPNYGQSVFVGGLVVVGGGFVYYGLPTRIGVMSANQVAVILSIGWLLWSIVLSRSLRVSWVPVLPVLFVVGLGTAVVMNHLRSPIGTILIALALVLVLPVVATVQLLLARRK